VTSLLLPQGESSYLKSFCPALAFLVFVFKPFFLKMIKIHF
jgi:hypothetical protein